MLRQHGHLQRLLSQVNVFDGEQAGAEGWHSAMPHDGGAGGWQHICQEGDCPRCQQHDVRVVLRIQQLHLKQQNPCTLRVTQTGCLICASSSAGSALGVSVSLGQTGRRRISGRSCPCKGGTSGCEGYGPDQCRNELIQREQAQRLLIRDGQELIQLTQRIQLRYFIIFLLKLHNQTLHPSRYVSPDVQ